MNLQTRVCPTSACIIFNLIQLPIIALVSPKFDPGKNHINGIVVGEYRSRRNCRILSTRPVVTLPQPVGDVVLVGGVVLVGAGRRWGRFARERSSGSGDWSVVGPLLVTVGGRGTEVFVGS